jgi:hypothetical protein
MRSVREAESGVRTANPSDMSIVDRMLASGECVWDRRLMPAGAAKARQK